MEIEKFKLGFELVPDGCWHSNLRYYLPPGAWDVVRKDSYARAHGKCMICGAAGRLEAHERWSYRTLENGAGVQKLEDVLAVCKACHEVIHINRTFLTDGEKRASEHFMKINGCNYSEYRAALGKANEAQKRLNEVSEWALDLTWLKRFT